MFKTMLKSNFLIDIVLIKFIINMEYFIKI